MEIKNYRQTLFYLSDADVREAVFFWLQSKHNAVPTPAQKISITSGQVNSLTVQYLTAVE